MRPLLLLALLLARAAADEPSASCTACLFLSQSVSDKLASPEVRRTFVKPADTKNRRPWKGNAKLGELETFVESFVEEQACASLAVRAVPETLGACHRMAEENLEAMVAAISKWYLRPETDAAAAGHDVDERSAVGRQLHEALCVNATRLCRLSDLEAETEEDEGDTDTAQEAEAAPPPPKKLTTERPPKTQTTPVHKIVGETLEATVNLAKEKDVLLYFYNGSYDYDDKQLTVGELYPIYKDRSHAMMGPRIERLAALLASLPRKPSSYVFGQIDFSRNDLFPPWDKITETQLAVFTPQRRLPNTTEAKEMQSRKENVYFNFKRFRWVEDLVPSTSTSRQYTKQYNASLKEILIDLSDESNGLTTHTRTHASNLYVALTDAEPDRFGGERWYEDDELVKAALAVDPEVLRSPSSSTSRPKKKKKKARKGRAGGPGDKAKDEM